MNSIKIHLCLAHMGGEEQKYVQEAFDTNWVTPLGPNVNAFEDDLRNFLMSASPTSKGEEMRLVDGITVWPENREVKFSASELVPDTPFHGLGGRKVLALTTGTAALHLALLACGVGPDDEVVCQSFTFCASCHPIAYLGANPVLVDSESDTWNIDPFLLEQAIKDRIAKTGHAPKAIVAVHLYGMPAKLDEIMAVAAKYGIPVVEDAAEALGSRYAGRACGTFGRFGVLSFNGNKMITTSGGGALVCPSHEWKQKMLFYATQAREEYPYYHHEEIGYNYRMSNICAGIGRGQMLVLDSHVAHHRRLAEIYQDAFSDVAGIALHKNPSPEFDSNYWLSTIVIDPSVRVRGEKGSSSDRRGEMTDSERVAPLSNPPADCAPNPNVEAIRLALASHGIESRPLWKPMHLQPVYAGAPAYINGVSETLFRTGLCLPSGPWVSEADALHIAGIIRESIV